MYDQANQLRQLVKQRVVERVPKSGTRPAMIVVTSGKGGVGATTLCANLAEQLPQAGAKTLLIDADPNGGDTSALCGLDEGRTLADVLAGRRALADVVQEGPGSLRIVPGVLGLERLSDYDLRAWDQLFSQTAALEDVDAVLFDVGTAPNRSTKRLWPAADMAIVVVTPDTSSILDTYSAIKAHTHDGAHTAIRVVVNRATGPETGRDVHERLAHACQRFLGIDLHWIGQLSEDPMVTAAGRAGDLFSVAVAGCDAAKQLVKLAQAFATTIQDLRQSRAHGLATAPKLRLPQLVG